MLLAFDLDKTIVTSSYELPQEIIDTILKVKEAGHYVSVLTGRPLAATLEYLYLLEIDSYYSVNHGSFVVGKDGEILRKSFIDAEHASEVMKPFSKHPEIEYSFVLDDVLYVKDPNDERWAWAHTANRYVKLFDPAANLAADKIVFSANGLSPEIHKHVSTINRDLVCYLWDDHYVEVTAKDADKGSALALIAGELGVAQKDVIAFGDGANDVSMIGWAGKGIAVGDFAIKDVLELADEHIASPEELGVKHWLEANLL